MVSRGGADICDIDLSGFCSLSLNKLSALNFLLCVRAHF
jgi:hypothetical protein